jgi:hypothetical protein
MQGYFKITCDLCFSNTQLPVSDKDVSSGELLNLLHGSRLRLLKIVVVDVTNSTERNVMLTGKVAEVSFYAAPLPTQ